MTVYNAASFRDELALLECLKARAVDSGELSLHHSIEVAGEYERTNHVAFMGRSIKAAYVRAAFYAAGEAIANELESGKLRLADGEVSGYAEDYGLLRMPDELS